ncbi:hypothetical protein ECG_08811 [Echinococcus granulosus]|nr:hypothetical protein ECG_08811 [Echinococcus granulosus]
MCHHDSCSYNIHVQKNEQDTFEETVDKVSHGITRPAKPIQKQCIRKPIDETRARSFRLDGRDVARTPDSVCQAERESKQCGIMHHLYKPMQSVQNAEDEEEEEYPK